MSQGKNILLPFNKSHAFIVGIDDYAHLNPLKTALNDARELERILKDEQGFDVLPHVANPGKEELLELFTQTIPKTVQTDDRILFYFAGHGIALDGEKGPNGYLVPADARYGDKDSLIPMDVLYAMFDQLDCKHGLIILDCCFSGAFKWSIGFRDQIIDLPHILYEERFRIYCQQSAWQVITSSAFDQKAIDVLSNYSLGMRENNGVRHSPFASALFEGIQGAADLIPREAGDGVITASELFVYLRRQVEESAASISKQQSPGIYQLHKHNNGEFIFLHPTHKLNLPPRPNKNPYMGLNSYDESDSDFFYGREEVVEDLVKSVQAKPLTVVVGASGTGKSSVIKAGLFPNLKEKGWEILPAIRPGKHPLDSWKKKFSGLDTKLKNKTRKVLLIDQYEELITRTAKASKRKKFEKLLAACIRKFKDLHVVISIRSDFEPQFEKGALKNWWKQGRYVIPLFSKTEIREVIKKPATQSVLFFEPENLIDRLEEDLSQASGALPLLSFTLSELYNAYLESGREDRALRLSDYEKLGGVAGALSTKADEIFSALNKASQNSMRNLMLRMVSLDGRDLGSRRIYMEELDFLDLHENERIHHIISRLVKARLLVKGRNELGRSFVEPAHDALIIAWVRLYEWVKEIGEDKLIVHKQLTKDAEIYHNLDLASVEVEKDLITGTSFLWDKNPKLDQILSLLETETHFFNTIEHQFISNSLKRREKSIYTLERERDYAVSVALSSKALQKVNTDSSKAIRLAEMAYKHCKPSTRDSEEALIQIFNNRTETPFYRTVFQGHNKYVNDIDISPDGELIVTGSTDHTFILWGKEGEIRIKIEAHEASVEGVRFIAGTSFILSAGMDSVLKVWDFSGNLIKTLKAHEKGISSLDIDSSGKFAASGDMDGRTIIWDLQSMLVKKIIDSHSSDVTAVKFSPDGQSILSASLNNSIKLWNLEGEEIQAFHGHTNSVQSIAFNQDGSKIASGSSDCSIKIWAINGDLLETMKGHLHMVDSVLFKPKSENILSGDSDGICIEWNIKGALLSKRRLHYRAISALAFTPDQQLLSASEDNTAKMWTKESNDELVLPHPDLVWALACSSTFLTEKDKKEKREILASGCDDGNIRLWNSKGKIYKCLSEHRGPVYTVKFSPDGSQLISAGKDGKIIFWEADGSINKILSEHQKGITHINYSQNGEYFLASSLDKRVYLYSFAGKQIKVFEGHNSPVRFASFYQEDQFVMSFSQDKQLMMWDSCSGKLKEKRELPMVKCLALSSDHKYLLTGNENHTACLWDLEGTKLQTYGGPRGHVKAIESVRFSPSGNYVITGSLDKNIKIWDRDGQMIQSLKGHSSKIRDFAFSADGKYLYSCGDRNIRQWWLPKKIAQWLKNSSIYALNSAEKMSYNISPVL